MGAGIVAVLLHQLPYQFPGVFLISVVFLILYIGLFILLFTLSIVRYALWPEILHADAASPRAVAVPERPSPTS
jgi:tellurite resistance protein TehA-like permease